MASIIRVEPRQSNIELLRIFAMFFIVAHHYVVNSGVLELYQIDQPSGNMVFCQLWSLWGKTAINAFVMISGYFMCTSRLTVRRYCKVFCEWMFYSIVCYAILLLFGFEVLSLKRLMHLFFEIFIRVDKGFTASFMWFYLGIPFYNALINTLNKRYLLMLNVLLLSLFVVPYSVFKNSDVFHHVFWYMEIYFLGAFVRLHPFRWMSSARVCWSWFVSLVLLACCSVIVRDFVHISAIRFVVAPFVPGQSCQMMCLLVGTFAFLSFKNLRVSYHPLINHIASTTFGVLCIHTASNAMRAFLWNDVCQVTAFYQGPLVQLVAHAIICSVGIFVTCSIIDTFRIRYLEASYLNLAERVVNKLLNRL